MNPVLLKKLILLRELVDDWTTYPFSVPTIASLTEINLDSRVVFFAGENGTGKSTLLTRQLSELRDNRATLAIQSGANDRPDHAKKPGIATNGLLHATEATVNKANTG